MEGQLGVIFFIGMMIISVGTSAVSRNGIEGGKIKVEDTAAATAVSLLGSDEEAVPVG